MLCPVGEVHIRRNVAAYLRKRRIVLSLTSAVWRVSLSILETPRCHYRLLHYSPDPYALPSKLLSRNMNHGRLCRRRVSPPPSRAPPDPGVPRQPIPSSCCPRKQTQNRTRMGTESESAISAGVGWCQRSPRRLSCFDAAPPLFHGDALLLSALSSLTCPLAKEKVVHVVSRGSALFSADADNCFCQCY